MDFVRARYTRWVLAFPLCLAPTAVDSTGASAVPSGADDPPSNACEGNRGPLPDVLAFELRAGAFPGSGHPDVAVHVPPRFDATRRPGVVLYFHGWNGCVAASVADEDAPCTSICAARPAAGLAAQIDEAHVNAVLVAVELRVDAPSGEPGQLAMPGDLHELLRELFSDHLADSLGCPLDLDTVDRVVVVAHSGGYQAAASAVRYGELEQLTEVDLLDALYGAEDIFEDWVMRAASGDVPRLRFVNLYTSEGGTADRSRSLASVARRAVRNLDGFVTDDDATTELTAESLTRPVVFKRVPRNHAQLPRAYITSLLRAAGFAPIPPLPAANP